MNFAARITGTGSAFPQKRMTNSSIVKKMAKLGVESNEKWILERTGIAERRHSEVGNESEYNSSLGLIAATKALAMAGKKPEDIDQIVYATCTGDTILPSTACWLQKKIGALNAWVMDINAACSGFIYGVATVEQFIKTGQTKTALVIGAEKLSVLLNWEDRGSCILFGDGAGAAVVEQVAFDSPGRILSSHMLSDGTLWEMLHVPGGGSNLEITPKRYARKEHKAKMNGTELFKVAVRTLTRFAKEELEKNNITVDDLDWFILHQANLRIINAVTKRLKIPQDKVLLNIERYGNTSSATIPTLLDEAVRDGRIKKGQLLLLDAFGAGLTFGSMLLRW